MTNIISILIALIPLIVVSGMFEVPKVFAFLTLGIILIFYLILNNGKIIFSKGDKFYLLWIFTLTISAVFGSDPKSSLLGGSYRHQGVIFYISLFLLIKFVNLLSPVQKIKLYKYISITIIIESLLVAFGYKLGTIGEINAVSGFLSIGLYFVYKSFPSLFVVFPLIGIILNFSKSSLLSLIPYVLKRSNLVVILFLLILIFIIKPINNLSIFENRFVIWKHATSLIKESPFIGYGAESNEMIFRSQFAESGFPLSGLIIDRSHNLVFDITLWSGLIGFIFFAKFVFERFKNNDSEKQKVLLSFLIFSMFQPLSVVHWILFALIV